MVIQTSRSPAKRKILYSKFLMTVTSSKIYFTTTIHCSWSMLLLMKMIVQLLDKMLALIELRLVLVLIMSIFPFLYKREEKPAYHTYPVSCASNASFHSFAVFHKEALENTNYSVELCQTLVDSPVYINDVDNFFSLLEMNYTEVLRMGFVLNWTAHSCSNCKRSGGRCGFDNTHEFVCFCSNGSHPKTCNDGNSIGH